MPAATLAVKGRARVRAELGASAVLAGLASFAAYALVLAALERASAASVAAVRETSVVMATAFAAVVLHERVSRCEARRLGARRRRDRAARAAVTSYEGNSERTAAVISAGPGRVASSRSFWYGIGWGGAPTRTTGASSSQKQCSRDVRRDLRSEAAELHGLVRDDEAVRLRDRRRDRVGVERNERPRIDDLDADALRLELSCDPERVRDHGAERHDRDVGAGPHDARRAELDRVALLGNRNGLAEEEELLLEEDDGVVVLDRRGEQALRIERDSTASRRPGRGCGRRAPRGSASAGLRGAGRRPTPCGARAARSACRPS